MEDVAVACRCLMAMDVWMYIGDSSLNTITLFAQIARQVMSDTMIRVEMMNSDNFVFENSPIFS
jgi:hypothetical protein